MFLNLLFKCQFVAVCITYSSPLYWKLKGLHSIFTHCSFNYFNHHSSCFRLSKPSWIVGEWLHHYSLNLISIHFKGILSFVKALLRCDSDSNFLSILVHLVIVQQLFCYRFHHWFDHYHSPVHVQASWWLHFLVHELLFFFNFYNRLLVLLASNSTYPRLLHTNNQPLLSQSRNFVPTLLVCAWFIAKQTPVILKQCFCWAKRKVPSQQNWNHAWPKNEPQLSLVLAVQHLQALQRAQWLRIKHRSVGQATYRRFLDEKDSWLNHNEPVFIIRHR